MTRPMPDLASTSGGLRPIARNPDRPQRPLDVMARLDRMAAETPDVAAIVLPDRRISHAALAEARRADPR